MGDKLRTRIFSFADLTPYDGPTRAHRRFAFELQLIGWSFLIPVLGVFAWSVAAFVEQIPHADDIPMPIFWVAVAAAPVTPLLMLGWALAFCYWASYARVRFLAGDPAGLNWASWLCVIVLAFEAPRLIGGWGEPLNAVLNVMILPQIALALALAVDYYKVRPAKPAKNTMAEDHSAQ